MDEELKIGEFVVATDYTGTRTFIGIIGGLIVVDFNGSRGKLYAIEDDLNGFSPDELKKLKIDELKPLTTFFTTLSPNKLYTLVRVANRPTEEQLTEHHVIKMKREYDGMN